MRVSSFVLHFLHPSDNQPLQWHIFCITCFPEIRIKTPHRPCKYRLPSLQEDLINAVLLEMSWTDCAFGQSKTLLLDTCLHLSILETLRRPKEKGSMWNLQYDADDYSTAACRRFRIWIAAYCDRSDRQRLKQAQSSLDRWQTVTVKTSEHENSTHSFSLASQ